MIAHHKEKVYVVVNGKLIQHLIHNCKLDWAKQQQQQQQKLIKYIVTEIS